MEGLGGILKAHDDLESARTASSGTAELVASGTVRVKAKRGAKKGRKSGRTKKKVTANLAMLLGASDSPDLAT